MQTTACGSFLLHLVADQPVLHVNCIFSLCTYNKKTHNLSRHNCFVILTNVSIMLQQLAKFSVRESVIRYYATQQARLGIMFPF